VAVVGAALAGCGGSGPSEDSIRERIEAAAAKTAAAPTLESTGQIEAEAGNGPEPTGCIHARIDRATTARVDSLGYRTVCGHRPPREEAIAIGKHAWDSPRRGQWVVIPVPPGLLTEFLDQAGTFDRLFAAASNFREGPDADEFDAPFSAGGTGPVAESGELHFDAVVDQAGYLTALTIAGAEEKPSVIVKDSYERFGAPPADRPARPRRDHRPPGPDQRQGGTPRTLSRSAVLSEPAATWVRRRV
jgi:hypothetical protein